ncbi:MAG: PAS domain-containing protein [Chloroflexi bacterium]|nr:PAS domain-containing protein [Chloroflexota bacterium]MCC6894259.1 PAS domain-containing protein [Anaerolineae bacterium]
MFSILSHLFAQLDIPPRLGNRHLRLLNWITIVIVVIAIVHSGATALVAMRLDVALFGLAAVVLSAVLNLIARRGYVRTASYIFILGMWVITTVPNVVDGGNGVFGAAFSAYIIPVLLAGFLLGGRVSYFVAFLSLGAGMFFVLRNVYDPTHTITYTSVDALLKLSSEAIYFFVAATLLAFSNRASMTAINRAQESEEQLALHNAELESQIQERQKVEAALRASEQTAQAFQDRLKALHEVGIELSSVNKLDDLYRQAVVLAQSRLGFDRMAWFVIEPHSNQLRGSYGTDIEGNIRNEQNFFIRLTLEDWTETLNRFTDKGHVRFLRDTPLWDNGEIIGQGWNAIGAVLQGEQITGWLVVDNLLHHEPLQDYQLELLRLYGAMLGQHQAQKQTQQVLVDKDERLNLALEAAHMRSWDWNIQTDTINRNDVLELSGLPVEQSYQSFITSIHPDDQHLLLEAARRMIEKTGFFEAEYRYIDQSNEARVHWLYSLGQPYRNTSGEIMGVAGVLQDITGRKQIEESLKRADQQALELALEKERVTVLSEFIHTISHDFKTPLAIINNSLYLLERIDDPKKHKDKLALIKEQTLLLDKQIQDILTISRLQYAPVVARHAVNINLLANKLGDLFHASLEKKNLKLELDLQSPLPNILANADELDRALTNLLENAINYTPNGGTITMMTRSSERQVEFAIQDTGIGMTPDDRIQIFNNFYRAENARMINSKGTGLGLAIVHKIVTLHEGTIVVESELGKGTCFRLYFPIIREAQ